jgi:hypothetical protein
MSDEHELCLNNLHTARLFKSLSKEYSELNKELRELNSDEVTVSECFHQYMKTLKSMCSVISKHITDCEPLRTKHLDAIMQIDKETDSLRQIISDKKGKVEAQLNGLSTKLNHLREIISVGIEDLIKSDDMNKKVCPVCFDREVNTVLIPCGHTYCEGCLHYGNYSRCPQCRETIQRRIKIYFTV